MVSGRPLLYLSLPGVAFILGVFWFRRRNKNRITNEEPKSEKNEEKLLRKNSTQDQLQTNGNIGQNKLIHKTSESVNINNSSSLEDENSVGKIFGKSAPINIVQNGRSISPNKQTHQKIDTEVLKTKMQNVEHTVLRSIDEDFENLSSPVDLPDSVHSRVSIYTRNIKCKKDEPVVIKATRTPKISPENSFFENKYICEQNNNITDIKKPLEPSKQDNIVEKKEIGKVHQNEEHHNNVHSKQNHTVESGSPSLSLCSVQSGDSGKGSSLPRSEATRAKMTYEFFFPNSLVGKLYGHRRSFVNQIKTKTSANILIRKSRYPGKLRICVIEGTESEINAALIMIRQRLPVKKYPNLTLQRIHYALPQTVVPLSTESLLNLQLSLVEGINNDIVVSAIITCGHIFIQHPLHPSHPHLATLQKCLYDSYSTIEAPLLPGIEISAVCVMPVNGVWYRVQIIDHDIDDEHRCIVKFLDFGGYMNVSFNDIRQIRSDFMALPFQATECVLSNIEPIGSCWSQDAADILYKLTSGIVLQAQIVGYNSHNIPEIYLFACLGPNNVIFINKELVARNLAQWVETRN